MSFKNQKTTREFWVFQRKMKYEMLTIFMLPCYIHSKIDSCRWTKSTFFLEVLMQISLQKIYAPNQHRYIIRQRNNSMFNQNIEKNTKPHTPLKYSVINIKGFFSVTAPRNCTIFGWRSFTSKLTSCLKSWLHERNEIRQNQYHSKIISAWKELNQAGSIS